MSFFRLRDIHTPPFATALNKDEIIASCGHCDIPFRGLQGSLAIEILATERADWRAALRGRAMLADNWLVGDAEVAAKLERLAPGGFEQFPVRVAAWQVHTRGYLTEAADAEPVAGPPADPPALFAFTPAQVWDLAPGILEMFPPIRCKACGRQIPDIPFDVTPWPQTDARSTVGALRFFSYEGYDYLFDDTVIDDFVAAFPEMVLERMSAEHAVM